MKTRTITLTFFIFLSCLLIAQPPQGINYQAVARDAAGSELQNHLVSVRFTIHDGTSEGTVVYQETDTVTTNKFGLFNLVIGSGTAVSGFFYDIQWSAHSKFLQVELDPTGGSNYMDMGTSQLQSVPYALNSAGWTTSGNNIYNTNTGGNVGIGTNSPTTQFHVKGGYGQIATIEGTAQSWLEYANSGVNIGYMGNWNGGTNDFDVGTSVGVTGNFNLTTQALPRMTIDSGGNVGIGTTIPSAPLAVNNTNSNASVVSLFSGTNPYIGLKDNSSSSAFNSYWQEYYGTMRVGNLGLTGTGGPISFYTTTGNTPVMTLIQNGSVGIGVSNPQANLEVSGTILIDSSATLGLPTLLLNNPNTAEVELYAGASGGDLFVNGFNTIVGITLSGPNAAVEPFAPSVTNLGSAVSHWQNVYALDGTIQTSDERKKKNIQNLDLGLDAVMQLRPVSYEWKNVEEGEGQKLGFVAQEVEKVIPQAVVHDHITDQQIAALKDAKKPAPEILDPYGMNYSEIIPVLVKAVQEQQQTINELKQQNAEMLLKIEQLQHLNK
jgi:hypothetical protein